MVRKSRLFLRPGERRERTISTNQLEERLRRCTFIVLDMDGVLTDGGIAFDGEGRPFRTVHVRDMTALTLWRLAGGRTAIVSGLGSKAVEAIAVQWQCTEHHMWVKDKARVCREIAQCHGVPLDEMAFLGDDIIDVRAMETAGLAVAVADAAPEAKKAAHLVLDAEGGKGPVRELVHRVLTAQGRLEEVLEMYCNRKDA